MFRFAVTTIIAMLVVCSVSQAEMVDVYVYNNQFSLNQPGQPVVSHITISQGDTVRWVWLQGNHTTTSVTGSLDRWNAPINSSNTQFTKVFNNQGIFVYYCIPHGTDNGDGTASGMHGSITVLPLGPGACCLGGGMCTELAPANCLSQGGTYQGDGTTCEPNPCAVDPTTMTIVADKDNVLYETVDGSLSNALGTRLFVGNLSSGAKRRSVVFFDISAIPHGSTVQSAELRLYCNQSQGATFGVSIHRLLNSWGEGTSLAGGNESGGGASTLEDATWVHRFWPGTFWNTPGGDFVSMASATTPIAGQNQFYSWTGSTVVSDVQHWVHMPWMNHGWIIRGDEATSANTKRFDSVQASNASQRPRLVITYIPSLPEQEGACCFSDGSCTEQTSSECDAMGGIYQGDGTMCHMVSCPLQPEKFVDALPRPAVAQPVTGAPGGAAHYEIAITEQFQQLHRDLPPTRTWGYGGSYPGPTIEAWKDETVTVVWKNDLRYAETGQLRQTHALVVDECLHGPDMTGQVPVAIVHLHGGKVAPESDGYPEWAFPPGEQSPVYVYPNNQNAATIWYHDHALGITRLNVMMGMAGFYIIRDTYEGSLNLPSGEYEIPLAVQDRSFHPDGSFKYPAMWHEHFFGDVMLVNGKVWPYLEVDRGKYRFRIVNGCNSRALTLGLSDRATFWQIGSDLGLLQEPVALTETTILPGERADIVVDFASYEPGTEIVLTNSAPAPFPGFPGVGVLPDVMKFVVQHRSGHTDPLPAFLVEIPRILESEAVRERIFDLRLAPNTHCPEHHDQMWVIDSGNGMMMWDDISEFPVLGSTEIWTWRNDSGISHPMHMHLVLVQVLDRQAIDPDTGEPTGDKIPPLPNEMGWKDTVHAPPGYYTRLITRFEGFTGRYPFHCHILEHEDHEMMRQFEVVSPCRLADINCDGVVDVLDLLILLGAWGPCLMPSDCLPDVNQSGAVDVQDLLILLANWG
ncbi:MAG TPA: DNRLRE domain-containing protein [Phycisphaerales bacterium]|nr:DNRLRE domain-containing protein [Phycisphaerales bacterium]HRQ74374.1 DNRLRE domain-containing protein [Phycisphaerales bacterium]